MSLFDLISFVVIVQEFFFGEGGGLQSERKEIV